MGFDAAVLRPMCFHKKVLLKPAFPYPFDSIAAATQLISNPTRIGTKYSAGENTEEIEDNRQLKSLVFGGNWGNINHELTRIDTKM